MKKYTRNIPDAIRGLTLERLSGQLDSYRNGYIAGFALTAEAMEERDDILRNVILKRKKAVTRHDWEVLAVDESEEAMEHQRALDYFYRNITCTYALKEDQKGGFNLLAHQMLDALAKGWAVHEVTWKPRVVGVASDDRRAASERNGEEEESKIRSKSKRERNGEGKMRLLTSSPTGDKESKIKITSKSETKMGLTAEMRFVPLWFFENTTGKLRYAARPFQNEGEEMKEREWLVTAADALMVPCSRAFLFKHFPLQSWLDYTLKYGLPAIKGGTTAARDTAQWDAMESALEDFLSELTVVTNTTESIDIVDLKGQGGEPFSELVERMDRVMAAIWRGADLSTISRDKGYGASLQEQESKVLERDDAQLISETLNRTLDVWAIKYLFGEEVEPKAYVKILVSNESTAHDLAVDEFLVRHGVKLSVADALERYGRSGALAGEKALEINDRSKAIGDWGKEEEREGVGEGQTQRGLEIRGRD